MSEVSFTRPVGWTDGRTRRVRLFAVGAVLAVALGLLSLALPWYAFSITGAPRCSVGTSPETVTLTTETYTQVPGIVGAGCITGYQTVHQNEMLAAAGVSTTPAQLGQGAMATPSSQFGLPSTAFFLALGGLLVAASTLLRNGFPGFVGIMVLGVAWSAFGSLQQAMAWGAGGPLNHPQTGLTVYGFALTFLMVSSVIGCGWVAWVNHTERAHIKRVARAEGREHELPATFVDHMAATVLRVAQQKAEKVTAGKSGVAAAATR